MAQDRRLEPAGAPVVQRIDGRLQLCERDAPHGACLDIDDVRRRLRQGRKLALAKACGARPALRVLDAMAGFGLDGITLAALGCDVVMIERDPQLFALLEDGLARARLELDLSGRVECREGDVNDVFDRGGDTFDTVYLDPMFAPREKNALPRRSAQLLALLADPPDDLAQMLAHARGVARLRVVLKRRRHDTTLGDPDWRILGRSVRFDVYRGAAPGV
ncbi:MAG TPA: class I SAM-dependent methyltransferase [Pseudomonadales bacterium]